MVVATAGITTHARQQAMRRLGADFDEDRWQSIAEGIAAKRWRSREPSDRRTPGRVWLVPLEHGGETLLLPVVARRERTRDRCHVVVVTIFRPEHVDGREYFKTRGRS